MSASDYLDARVRTAISPVEVMGLMEQKPDSLILVDVRNGTVPSTIRGAIRIPEESIASWIGELPREKLIVLYSEDSDSDLATKAALTLLAAGFDAKQLNGGIAAWTLLRLPLDDEAP